MKIKVEIKPKTARKETWTIRQSNNPEQEGTLVIETGQNLWDYYLLHDPKEQRRFIDDHLQDEE